MDKESKLEEEILASFDRGEWQPSSKGKAEIARFAAMASVSLAKDKRVNIRISSRDLDDIQARAAEEASLTLEFAPFGGWDGAKARRPLALRWVYPLWLHVSSQNQ